MKKTKIGCLLLVFAICVHIFPLSVYAGTYQEYILDVYSEQNSSAGSAPQQAVNGSYRTVDLLTIIALCLDT